MESINSYCIEWITECFIVSSHSIYGNIECNIMTKQGDPSFSRKEN